MRTQVLTCSLLVASAAAFAPSSPFGVTQQQRSSTAVCAKHVQDKAARWAASKRPKKSRPSDINKSMRIYDLYSIVKPAEYTISSEPAVVAAKKGK